MDDFFDVTVIECKPARETRQLWTSSQTKVERRPIFIGRFEEKYKRERFWTLKLHNISALSKPLEMTDKLIAKFYGLPTNFRHLTDLYNSFDVAFNFYRLVDDSNRCIAYTSNDLPGTRRGNYRQISIGAKDDKMFWLSPKFPIKEKLYCRVHPDKCGFWETRQNKLERHEQQCTDTTIVTPKKVIIFFKYVF